MKMIDYLKHHGRICNRQFLHNLAVAVLHHGLVLAWVEGCQLFWSSPLFISVCVIFCHAVFLHAVQEGGQGRRKFAPWNKITFKWMRLQISKSTWSTFVTVPLINNTMNVKAGGRWYLWCGPRVPGRASPQWRGRGRGAASLEPLGTTGCRCSGECALLDGWDGRRAAGWYLGREGELYWSHREGKFAAAKKTVQCRKLKKYAVSK